MAPAITNARCASVRRRLFGILSVPNGSDNAAPAVILLNTGLETRVGPHRLYVPLARELSAQGHLVLRYDLGGIGDSEPPAGSAENVPYPAHALDDAREAIAFIRSRRPAGGSSWLGCARAGGTRFMRRAKAWPWMPSVDQPAPVPSRWHDENSHLERLSADRNLPDRVARLGPLETRAPGPIGLP